MLHVARQLRQQLRARRWQSLAAGLLRRALKVCEHRRVERIAGVGDAGEIGAVAALQIFDDRPVVGDEGFDDGTRSLRTRLVLGLHAPHGLDGNAGGPAGLDVAPDNDRGDGRESERQSAPDSRAAAAAAAVSPLGGGRSSAGRVAASIGRSFAA